MSFDNGFDGNGGKSRAWVLLFLHGVVLALGGTYWIARGHAFDRDLYEALAGPSWPVVVALAPEVSRLTGALVRIAGALALAGGILVMSIASTSFRRGERWSWYAAWALPVHGAIHLATLLGYGAMTPASAAWSLALLLLSLGALVGSASLVFAEPPPIVRTREGEA